jgi:hypothetical protein
MAASAQNVIVGVGGLNGAAGIAWFAPVGTALPVGPDAALNGSFLDAGLVSTAGLVEDVSETTSDVEAFGLTVPVRSITTQSKRSFKVSFLETNAVTLAVYNRLLLSSVVAETAMTPYFSISLGPVLTTQWAAVFDIVDGINHIRFCCPFVQNTTITALPMANGAAVERGVELTAFPDNTGYAVYEYDQVAALS